MHLKCFKRCRAQELTVANCAARMKHAKLLLQKFLQYATDFVFFTDKKMFSITSPNNRQNKVSDRLRELLKKKLSVFFSAGTGCSAALPGHLLTLPVSRNFLNSLLTPRFVQLFSGNSSVNLFAVYTFKCKIFLSKSCPRHLIPCWLVTNTAATSAVTNFRCHKLIAKVNNGKFYLHSVWRKIRYFKHRNIKICGSLTKLEVTKNAICLRFLQYLQKIWIFNFPR